MDKRKARELRQWREDRKAQRRYTSERWRARRRRELVAQRQVIRLLYIVAMVAGLVLVWWWLITR